MPSVVSPAMRRCGDDMGRRAASWSRRNSPAPASAVTWSTSTGRCCARTAAAHNAAIFILSTQPSENRRQRAPDLVRTGRQQMLLVVVEQLAPLDRSTNLWIAEDIDRVYGADIAVAVV